jgi:hypothetical protein
LHVLLCRTLRFITISVTLKLMIMKKLKDGFAIVFAILMVLSGCAKNEESVTNVPAAVSDRFNFPDTIKPEPGIEPSDPIPGPHYDDVGLNPPRQPYTRIENPTAEYIKETCLFDISKMEVGRTYHQINNKNINIAFSSFGSPTTVQRLVPTSSLWAWNAHWNYSPYVEKENPEVLFTPEELYFEIFTSKPCIEFGVEVAPNLRKTDVVFNAGFGTFVPDNSIGFVKQHIKTPSGSRLFAVKATKPFTVITITFSFENGSPDFANLPGGMAIANIRYKLAE